MAQYLDNEGLKALWDKIKKTYALKNEAQSNEFDNGIIIGNTNNALPSGKFGLDSPFTNVMRVFNDIGNTQLVTTKGVVDFYVLGKNIVTVNGEGMDLHNFSIKNCKNLQEKLVSGTNIKTVNGNSLLGSGDLSITASIPSTTIVSDSNTTGYFSYDSVDWGRWRLKTSDGTKQIQIYLNSIHLKGGNNSLTALTFRGTWTKIPAVFVQEKINFSADIGSTYRNGLQVQDITKTGCNIRNNKGEAIYVNVMVIGW